MFRLHIPPQNSHFQLANSRLSDLSCHYQISCHNTTIDYMSNHATVFLRVIGLC